MKRGASAKPPTCEVGRPAAVDAEARDLQVAARDLEVELPRMEVAASITSSGSRPRLAHIELRHGRRRARPAELEAALVELEIARDRAALPVGLESAAGR